MSSWHFLTVPTFANDRTAAERVGARAVRHLANSPQILIDRFLKQSRFMGWQSGEPARCFAVKIGIPPSSG